MTRLLVSVRDASEAAEAVGGGADLVDVKEPGRGSLGAADSDVWAAVRRVVGGQRPLSVALGELLDDPIVQNAPSSHGYQFAKIGLAGCADCRDWPARWSAALRVFPDGVAAVAVVYADAKVAKAPPPFDVLGCAIDIRCRAMLVDTYAKAAGGLFESISSDVLSGLVERARRQGLLVVLGGSLDERSLARALEFAPDFVAVRQAVCRGGRRGSLDRLLVRRLAGQLAAVA